MRWIVSWGSIVVLLSVCCSDDPTSDAGFDAVADGPAEAAADGRRDAPGQDVAGEAAAADSAPDSAVPVFAKVDLVAGVPGTKGYSDGSALGAKFFNPAHVEVDASGTLYIGDHSHTVRKVSAGLVSPHAGDGVSGFKDGPAAAARFHLVTDLALGAGGTIYVADPGNQRIRRIDNGTVSTVAGDGTAGYLNGTALSARFNNPMQVAANAAGELIVADAKNHCIRRLSGGKVTTLTGKPGGMGGYLNGPLAAALFRGPTTLDVDSKTGTLYAQDLNLRIREIGSTAVKAIAGNGKTSGDGALPAPGMAVDSDKGMLYVATDTLHRIVCIELNGGYKVHNVAGDGTPGHKLGPPHVARFHHPRDVAFEPKTGKLYVADAGNHVIKVLVP